MEKVLIIDKAFDVFRGVVIGRMKYSMKVEIKKNDFSERKDRMMKTIAYQDILTTLPGRIEIIHLKVFL